MKDIGMHPDTRSMHPDLKNFETVSGEGDECPWCKERVEDITDTDLGGLFQSAAAQDVTESVCGNCGAKLEITHLFVPLSWPYSASVEFEIKATKRVA